MEELRKKCAFLQVNWTNQVTSATKKRASAVDIEDQMMRMKTNRTPAVNCINVFFRGEDSPDSALEAIHEWHDKYVAFRSMHQPGTPADAASTRPIRQKRSVNKKTPCDRQNHTSEIQAAGKTRRVAPA